MTAYGMTAHVIILNPVNPLVDFNRQVIDSSTIVLCGFERIHKKSLISQFRFPPGTDDVTVSFDSPQGLNLSRFRWPPGMRTLTLLRVFEKDRSGCHSVLTGLKVPVLLRSLRVRDYTHLPFPVPDNFEMTGNMLQELLINGLGAGCVRRMCRMVPRLECLGVTHAPFDGDGDLSWVPSSIFVLELKDCGQLSFSPCCLFPKLGEMKLSSMTVLQFSPRMDILFPALTRLDVQFCGLRNIKGVVFPSTLTVLKLSHNRNISLEGAVFPSGLIVLCVSHCGSIEGIDSIVYPRTLAELDFAGNGITQFDAFKLPPMMVDLYLGANEITDWRSVLRYLLRYSVRWSTIGEIAHPEECMMRFARSDRAASVYRGLGAVFKKYYSSQDALLPLLCARHFWTRCGNAAIRKLPGDLVRVTLGFLAKVPKL